MLGETCVLLSSCTRRDSSCSSCHSAPEPCSLHLPVDGEWSGWSPWSPCPSDLQCCGAGCDAGTQRRERTCSPPQYGGKDCQGEREQSRDCSPPSCPGRSELTGWDQDQGLKYSKVRDQIRGVADASSDAIRTQLKATKAALSVYFLLCFYGIILSVD